MSQFEPGSQYECLSIFIQIKKELVNINGEEKWRYGFSVGGGIDQDYTKSSQGFTDSGIYVTKIEKNSSAYLSGLQVGDKILQCNNYDLTMVTHKKALDYIKKYDVLNILVARKGVTYI